MKVKEQLFLIESLLYSSLNGDTTYNINEQRTLLRVMFNSMSFETTVNCIRYIEGYNLV